MPAATRARLDDATKHVEAALEGVAVEANGGDEELADARHARAGGDFLARRGRPARRASRAGAHPRPRRHSAMSACAVRRAVRLPEGRPCRPRTRPPRELDACGGAQEIVGNLEEDAGAVAGVGVGTGGAAMAEVDERAHRQDHDVVVGVA